MNALIGFEHTAIAPEGGSGASSGYPSDIACLLGVLKPDFVFMLHAFFDESGTDAASAYTCVAGYLFETGQYMHFEREWGELLLSSGLSCFHMADCAHGVNEFQNIAKSRRSELAERCIGIIKRRASAGAMVSMAQSDFRALKVTDGIDSPYVICLLWCMQAINAFVDRYGRGQKVSYFFERGAKLQARADAALEWQQKQAWSAKDYHSHSFIGKNCACGLQAADLLAWEWQRELNRRRGSLCTDKG